MDRKDELTRKALEYFLEHGLANLSLRPLAAQIGSSSRLLIYHFETKEGLIATVMDEARRRLQQSLSSLLQEKQGHSSLTTFWHWAVQPENSRYLRLFFETQVLALQNPQAYAKYVARNSSSWIAVIESALPPMPDRSAIATLCGAVTDGLLLEYLSSGDLERTTAALSSFEKLLKNRH
jgi:AcrR family transcriptional regulator